MAQIGINCGGRPVLRVYGVKAQLEELDAPLSLDYAGEKAAGPAAEYCFAGHGVEIKLTLKYSGSVTLGWLEGKIAQQGQGFHRQRSFRADHGVTVEFAQEPHCTGVMANYGHKDWWTRPAFTAQFKICPLGCSQCCGTRARSTIISSLWWMRRALQPGVSPGPWPHPQPWGERL